MRKIFRSILLSLFSLPVILAVPALAKNDKANEKPIWLVVTKPIFLEAIRPLQQERCKNGLKTVISTQPVPGAITALERPPAFLLLVGDDELGKEDQPWYIPSKKRRLYRWQATQEKRFASDTLWGDFNDDLVPDIPVGRIPARTAKQLKPVVNKILAFENKQPTLDELRLPIWAGTAGYNQMFNMMATELLLNAIRTNTSEWLRPWIISADTMHPLCGWPPDQWSMFTKQLKRGGVMAVLMGHGSDKNFYSMSFNGKQLGYSAAHARKTLATGKPAPPMVIIACSTGNFTGADNCLAESLLLMPGGPVAVIGATTESHPLTNYFSGLCLVKERGEKDKRLGSIWLAAQQKAITTRDFIIERMLCNIEGKLEEKINIAKLRRDQILMYALLGDPATRMHLPGQLNANIKLLGNRWHWDVEKPKDATKLYVGFRPDGQTFPKAVLQLEKNTALKLFQQANDTFAFRALGELTVDKTWKGIIDEEGTLRLVAVGPGRFYAAAFKLKFLNTQAPIDDNLEVNDAGEITDSL